MRIYFITHPKDIVLNCDWPLSAVACRPSSAVRRTSTCARKHIVFSTPLTGL